MSRAGAPPKLILMTSTTSGEGKTVTSTNTAVLFAHTGAKVLLIDADLRRPRCHRVFRMDKEPGLTEVLTGGRAVFEMIRPTQVDGLSILTSGSLPPNPTELLGSEKMKKILGWLAESFDFMVYGFAAGIAGQRFGFALNHRRWCGGVVNSAKTAKQQIRVACARLKYARSKIFGIVLNKVNLQSPEYKYYKNYYFHYSNEVLEGNEDFALPTPGDQGTQLVPKLSEGPGKHAVAGPANCVSSTEYFRRCCSAMIFLAPMAFGSVYPWAYRAVEAACFACSRCGC